MKDIIKKLVEKAIDDWRKSDASDSFEVPEVEISNPKDERHGDYTTNIAMIVSKEVGKKPEEIAEKIKENIKNDFLGKVEVIKPGYLNFYLSEKYLQEKVGEVNKLGSKFGNSNIGKKIKVNNEFISANPTGPLHLGNGRGGFYGDAISNVLEKANFDVVREYYVNDAGEQVIKLGHSVLKDDEAVYSGEYIDNLNKQLSGKEDDIEKVGYKAAGIVMKEIIKETIEKKMKINNMNYVHEKDLYDSKKVDEALEIIKGKGLTYKKDGALWLKSTSFRDDKDRVLIKSDGQKTYLASDCGYILNKMDRKFSRIVEIWGADHHGYIARFKAVAEALGFEGDIKFIIVQLVRLTKDGKETKMSKRAGNVVYIDELIEEVGHDVARFFFLMYSPDTHMNFDLGVAKERSEKNPVYYVQYAHARICSILGKAAEMKIDFSARNGDLSKLSHKKELSLAKELNKFPELIEEISQSYEVHKLPQYAIRLADKLHSFYGACRVLDDPDQETIKARLNLINAVRIVLDETLRLIGADAPKKM